MWNTTTNTLAFLLKVYRYSDFLFLPYQRVYSIKEWICFSMVNCSIKSNYSCLDGYFSHLANRSLRNLLAFVKMAKIKGVYHTPHNVIVSLVFELQILTKLSTCEIVNDVMTFKTQYLEMLNIKGMKLFVSRLYL